MNLTEILIASGISFAVAASGGSMLMNQNKSSQTLERRERLRADWEKATKFINSEIKLAERILDQHGQLQIGSECGIQDGEFRMAIDARRDLPLIVYGVVNEQAYREWHDVNNPAAAKAPKLRGENVLVRCGPAIDAEGNYSQQVKSYVLIDGLNANAAGAGFSVTASGQKLANYQLALRGYQVANLEQSRSTLARINPLYTRPSAANLCGAANYVKLAGTNQADTLVVQTSALNNGDDMLICGFGGGDHITGTGANEIIECGSVTTSDTSACTLIGGAGNDVLRGGHGHDQADGGEGNDVLIGGAGGDELIGGNGENRYLPGSGNDSINGGNGLDIVFFEGTKTHYSTTNCTQSSCTVESSSEGNDQLTNVEILIFTDGRLDLPGNSDLAQNQGE